MNKDWKKMLVDLEKKLNEIFGEKAPKLPDSVAKFLVKYGPYFMIFGVVVGVGFFLMSLGLLVAILPLARSGYYGYSYNYGFRLWDLFGLVVMVLQVMAIPGLFKTTKAAWNLMFYASLITAVSYLVTMNIGGLIIGMAINWYFLFQIRKFYK